MNFDFSIFVEILRKYIMQVWDINIIIDEKAARRVDNKIIYFIV